MDPKAFLELTEATLLTDVSKYLKEYFAGTSEIFTKWDEAQEQAGPYKELYQKAEDGSYQRIPESLRGLLYFKRDSQNPRSAILPMAQVNMVANITFHLMAQQIAVLFALKPGTSREKVFETTFENVRKLVLRYVSTINEEDHGKGYIQGHSAESERHT